MTCADDLYARYLASCAVASVHRRRIIVFEVHISSVATWCSAFILHSSVRSHCLVHCVPAALAMHSHRDFAVMSRSSRCGRQRPFSCPSFWRGLHFSRSEAARRHSCSLEMWCASFHDCALSAARSERCVRLLPLQVRTRPW